MIGQPMPGGHEGRDPLASFSLDTLLAGAARLRPDTVAFADRDETLTCAAAAARSAAMARLLTGFGLRPGERVLLIGGASVAVSVALIAALRAGFDLALAPLDLDAAEVAACAREVGAVALIGPTRYGTLAAADICLAAAAEAASIRLVATLGPDEVDGAIDLSAAAIARFAAGSPDDSPERGKPPALSPPRIITLEHAGGHRRPVVHRQSTLIAAGLDLVSRARIGRRTPILTTMPPLSLAGVVGGPVAALLTGAELHLDGPFAAEPFLAALDRLRDAHLVAPAAIAADLVRAGVTECLASLILCTRFAAPAAFVAPSAFTCGCPIVDLYAIGERAAVPELRQDGEPFGLAPEPHFITFDGARILAVQGLTPPYGDVGLEGAAVTGDQAAA